MDIQIVMVVLILINNFQKIELSQSRGPLSNSESETHVYRLKDMEK